MAVALGPTTVADAAAAKPKKVPHYTFTKKRPHKAKKVYTLSGTCKFPVQSGGKPGVATVSFAFRYAINPTSRAAAHASPSVIATSLRLAG